MTLRMETVAAELSALIARHEETRAAAGAAIEEARAALRQWSDDPVAASARIERALAGLAVPYALAEDDPAATFPAPPPGPVTVVAADGSSITPDRFSTVRCYAINIGHAVLPYGVGGEPSLEAVAEVGLDADLLEGAGDMRQAPRGLATRLLRDVRELERGIELALPAAAAGPAVLLLDGTLLPWDLHTRQASDEALAPYRTRTIEALDAIRACGEPLSMGAYISASAAREVVAGLEVLAPPPPSAPPLTDGDVFRGLLAPGERSALFHSRSSRRGSVESLLPGHEVALFYLRVGDDVARVELPAWAASPAQLDRLHATLVDQCERCEGYPRALQEAHEQAVISASDRQQFERLLDRLAGDAGIRPALNGKQHSKRRRSI